MRDNHIRGFDEETRKRTSLRGIKRVKTEARIQEIRFHFLLEINSNSISIFYIFLFHFFPGIKFKHKRISEMEIGQFPTSSIINLYRSDFASNLYRATSLVNRSLRANLNAKADLPYNFLSCASQI